MLKTSIGLIETGYIQRTVATENYNYIREYVLNCFVLFLDNILICGM